MCARAAGFALSEAERSLLVYLGRHAVEYYGMGKRERFPGAFEGLHEKGLVSALGGSNLTLRLTTQGLEELYRLLDEMGTLTPEELDAHTRELSPAEHSVLLRVLHGTGLVKNVAAMVRDGVDQDALRNLVTKGLLQYTGFPYGPTEDVYLTEVGYQVARRVELTPMS